MHIGFKDGGVLHIRPETESDCMIVKYFLQELKTHGLRMIDVETSCPNNEEQMRRYGYAMPHRHQHSVMSMRGPLLNPQGFYDQQGNYYPPHENFYQEPSNIYPLWWYGGNSPAEIGPDGRRGRYRSEQTEVPGNTDGRDNPRR